MTEFLESTRYEPFSQNILITYDIINDDDGSTDHSTANSEKCDASHLSHFWEECDALAHENIFLTCDVFCRILPDKRHILAPPVQNVFEQEEM